MRRLLLFRHAKAERSIPGGADRDRNLVERGCKDAARIGAYMAGHALIPDRVLVSPAARAQETWKYAAKAFKPAPAATSVERLYDATPHAIMTAVGDVANTAHTVLVIGHNPGLHQLAGSRNVLELHGTENTVLLVVTHSDSLAARFARCFELSGGQLSEC